MDATLVGAIVAGLLAIIAVLVPGIISIIKAIGETKREVMRTVETVTDDQNKKLDKITVLVDGRYLAVLNELATMKEMFAHLTGLHSDKKLAQDARSAADAQASLLVESKAIEEESKP